MSLRVLIAAGGTGGHIYPGLAVANELARRHQSIEIRFIGNDNGMESRIVPQYGFGYSGIKVKGLVGVKLTSKVRSLGLLPTSCYAVFRLLRSFRPHVVVGTGCYVAGPVVLTAAALGVPTLVLEAHTRPGLTNRLLAPFVTNAALWFESALPYFKRRGVITGNPVRQDFFKLAPKPRDPNGLHVLVYGGSQSARAINEAVIESLPFLAEQREKLFFTHEAGDAQYEKVLAGYEAAGWGGRARVERKIASMPQAYAAADLVVCRAGASTSAELAAAGKPAVMIPYPYAADDHQRKIAGSFSAAGAAELIHQQDLSGRRLADAILSLLSDPTRLTEMGKVMRSLAHPEATSKIADIVEALGRSYSEKNRSRVARQRG